MKPLRRTTYPTVEELEAIIKEREAEAAMLPPGMSRQSVLRDVARLRSYAEMKRLLA
jgi:hypothetical protein